MIGGVGADDAGLAGRAARHAQRDLVGLGARAAEDDALDRRTVEGREALGEGDDAFVQIAAVDVERGLLARHRLDDMRVGMTDAGHVVVHVDVAAAVGIEQVDALAADDVQGRVVEQGRAGSQARSRRAASVAELMVGLSFASTAEENHSIAGRRPWTSTRSPLLRNGPPPA